MFSLSLPVVVAFFPWVVHGSMGSSCLSEGGDARGHERGRPAGRAGPCMHASHMVPPMGLGFGEAAGAMHASTAGAPARLSRARKLASFWSEADGRWKKSN